MARAAVLIGVNRTGKLPKLADAVEGAKRMENWALAHPQSMKREHVLLFTDEKGPVDIGEIRRAIRGLVKSGTIEQLIVYFAGHGVNIRYNEYWLLSDAPEDASAAVNVDGSVVLARRCGIPHVVLISDACRTAAEGVQAQGVTGGEIFPNDPVAGTEASVDIFFGTTLGRPALEIKNPQASSNAFEAVYTSTLLDAFKGKLPTALKVEEVQGRSSHVVRPRPLKACLFDELPKRLATLGLHAEVSQLPDARITSDDDAWLVRFGQLVVGPVTRSAGIRLPSPESVVVDEILDAPLGRALRGGRPTPTSAQALDHTIDKVAPEKSFIPTSISKFETHCGFLISGSAILEIISISASSEILEPERNRVSVVMAGSSSSVLIVLEDGSSVFLPALRDQVGHVMISPDEGITDISYEPIGNSLRWLAFAPSANDLRSLRMLAAAAARDNSLRLDARLADQMQARLRYRKYVDPSLALYTAYALHDAGLQDRLRGLAAAVLADLGPAFLDLELLSHSVMPNSSVLRFPILARGWSLLNAFGMTASPEIDALRAALRESLWTHFNEDGTRQLKRLISTRRLL